MRIDESLRDRWVRDDEGWSIDVPEGWGQGRSVFGGLSAAFGVALAERALGGGGKRLRQINLQLMRPTKAGRAQGAVRLVREGKSTNFVEVSLDQDGEQIMRGSLIYGTSRPEAMRLEAPRAWTGPDPEDLILLPFIPGVMPDFLQHVDMRWASGNPPFTSGSEAHFTGYCRFREPAGGVEGLVALLDLWPCPSLSLLDKPTPASTVSWTAHFLEVPEVIDDFFAFEYRTIAAGDGYHTVAGSLHDPSGKLIAWTEQLMAVFA